MFRNKSPQTQRTGPLAGPVSPRLLMILICLFSTIVSAQSDNKEGRVNDSVLGVGIGTTLDEAHRKLDALGVNGGRDTRGGGRKESWALESTDFSAVALKTNSKGEVVWISGFVRTEQAIPFANLGDVAATTRFTESEAIWNVETSEGGYRLVAKGQNGKAHVVYLLSLETPPVQ